MKERVKIPLDTKFHDSILKIEKIGPLLGKNNKKPDPLLRKIFLHFWNLQPLKRVENKFQQDLRTFLKK